MVTPGQSRPSLLDVMVMLLPDMETVPFTVLLDDGAAERTGLVILAWMAA